MPNLDALHSAARTIVVLPFLAFLAFNAHPLSVAAQAPERDGEGEATPTPARDEEGEVAGTAEEGGGDAEVATTTIESEANSPTVGAETLDELEVAADVVPGEPAWMTPELRARLDDPEEAAAIRGYFHQPTLVWEPQWSTFGWADVGVLAGLATVGLVGQFVSHPETPNWTGGILGDESIREGMALDGYDDREAMATLSDDLLGLLMLYPYLVDGVVMSLLIHEAPEAAAEMMLVDTMAYALTFAVVNITKKSVARQRPFVQECAGNPEYADGCNPNDGSRNASFVSGHSAFAFTAAGLMCAHHLNLPIHGDPLADGMVCAGGLLAASTVGILRIMSDRHWASDVYSGAALGLLAGWLMPTLLRYQSWNPLPYNDRVKMVPTPQVGPNQLGLGVTGIF